MEGGLHSVSATVGRTLIAVLAAAAALLLAAAIAPPDAPAAKKIRACVAKKGPDKGVMRYSRSGKCHKGEKKLSWNKKGKAGAAGQGGASGPAGSNGVTDELLETIATQETKIEALTTQVESLTALLNGLAPQVAALCTQVDAVTDRVNTLGTVISGLGLNNVLDTLGGALTFATSVPPALPAFSCP